MTFAKPRSQLDRSRVQWDCPARTGHGFSLIELMVTLSIAGVLIAVAVPAFQSIAQSNRAASQTNDLVSALQLARSEAVTQRDPVSISRIGDSWNNGWQVWVDSSGDGTMQADEVLRTFEALSGSSTLANGGTDTLSFSRDGFLAAPGSAITFSLQMYNCRGNNNRSIAVGLNGRVSAQAVDCP